MGAIIGYDMTAALAVARGLAVPPRHVVELLPVIEAALIRKLRERTAAQ